MTVKNVSTGKMYPVTKEEFEKNFKGKLNWRLIDSEEIKPEQIISNTIKSPKDFFNTNKTEITTEKKTNKQKK